MPPLISVLARSAHQQRVHTVLHPSLTPGAVDVAELGLVGPSTWWRR